MGSEVPEQDRQHLETLASIKNDVLAELDAIGCASVIHNDIKGPNVLISEDSVTLVDWESATLGPHGASLRRFTRYGQAIESLAVRTYVDATEKLGLRLDQAQVLRVMRFQEIFWATHTGIYKKSKDRVLMGLRLFRNFSLGRRHTEGAKLEAIKQMEK